MQGDAELGDMGSEAGKQPCGPEERLLRRSTELVHTKPARAQSSVLYSILVSYAKHSQVCLLVVLRLEPRTLNVLGEHPKCAG